MIWLHFAFQMVAGIEDEVESDLYSPGVDYSDTGLFYGLTPDEGPEYREGSLADQSIQDVRRCLLPLMTLLLLPLLLLLQIMLYYLCIAVNDRGVRLPARLLHTGRGERVL